MFPEQGARKIQLTNTITVEDFGSGLILTYKRRLYVSFIFAVLIFTFVGAMVFVKVYATSEDLATTMVLPALIVVGLLFLYWAAALYLDTATTTVTKQKIQVHRGPIRFPKDRTIPSNSISQVFHERRFVTYSWRRRWAPDASAESDAYVRYVLGVVTVDKRKIILLKEIPSESDAKALEGEIERWLGIVDRPVENELRSILAGSGLWTRLTYSSRTGTLYGSPLFFGLLGAAFVGWGTLVLASGQILIGRRSHTTVSFDHDPLIFSVLVLLILGTASWCLYKSWRIFTEAG